MNHSFIPSPTDSILCSKCKRPELDHTENAICECCPNVGPCEVYLTMLMCSSCLTKQKELQAASESQAEARVLDYRNDSTTRLAEAKAIDLSIQVKSDVFNAETVSIIELKEIIDSNIEIPEEQKNFELAKVLTDRINGFKKAIFELNSEVIDKVTSQRAIQTYLNDLSNKLRSEEREKLKLADINYKPLPQKVSKPRESKVRKFDKTEIRKYALIAGVPESVIQMVCIAKNMTPEMAANTLKGNMK